MPKKNAKKEITLKKQRKETRKFTGPNRPIFYINKYFKFMKISFWKKI